MLKDEAKLARQFASVLASQPGDAIPMSLIGATIIDFGTLPQSDSDGGGLVIDYRTPESSQVMRLELAFNELGMWVDKHFPMTAAIPESICELP